MKKKPVRQQNEVFLFFVFAALIMVFGLVLVGQMRDARFDARLSSIEDSVTRIENSTGQFVNVMERYERALALPGVDDEKIEVGVGDSREPTN